MSADTELDIRPVPVGWCARCDDEHGPDDRCWAYVRPRTADCVAWSAYCRALDAITDSHDPREASPEVLDHVARYLADQAYCNRERAALGESG